MKNKFTYSEIAANVKNLRVPGHKLTLEWSGEHGAESVSTGYCGCGKWDESASNQHEARWEYKCHLARLIFNKERVRCEEDLGYDDFERCATNEDWGLLRIRCQLTRLSEGEILRLSANHWIERKTEKVYVSNFVNMVGGLVSRRHKTLDEAYIQVCKSNQEIVKRKRVKL